MKQRPHGEETLSVDVGATSMKAALVSRERLLTSGVERRKTRPPISPDQFLEVVATLASKLAMTSQGVVGFPGIVDQGVVLSPDNLVAIDGPGSLIEEPTAELWSGFALQERLQERLERDVVVANDADIAALGCASGVGLELTVTLGTGIGTGLVNEGVLLPHREFSKLTCLGEDLVDMMAGEEARKHLAPELWENRVFAILAELLERTECDRCFVAGGNARRLSRDRLREFGGRVWVVAEPVGLLGAVPLLDQRSGEAA